MDIIWILYVFQKHIDIPFQFVCAKVQIFPVITKKYQSKKTLMLYHKIINDINGLY